MPFRIKICGVTQIEQAESIADAGADAIGLNFYPKSRRFVAPTDALSLANAIRQANRRTKIIGVFVNATIVEIAAIARQVGLDGVQFHGDEPASEIEAVRREYKARGGDASSLLMLRAIRTKPAEELKAGDGNVHSASEIQRIENESAAWQAAGCDCVLLDAAMPGEFGGTGKVVDWNAVARIKRKLPLVLAGGLNATNVAAAIMAALPDGVDTASGVENAAGIKDLEKVRKFVAAAKAAFDDQDRRGA